MNTQNNPLGTPVNAVKENLSHQKAMIRHTAQTKIGAQDSTHRKTRRNLESAVAIHVAIRRDTVSRSVAILYNLFFSA